ncbi:DUF5131 family protein [Bythopirellula goksoeyrii]|uniref:Phage protein Gp37/Gp68 n=1 Tax=Bythopirellula goksoeyrii TaxID=1400387 RepID=A0A5B9QB45_9BACT|nr:DUF5131 family protein [Bythopirellula goksoeyrii]QEG36148.1 Phage protein Gp37/Gp68 [Bythopirellula goksoeyrii]
MAEKSGIGWTHHTVNPWWGCEKVGEVCRHCYIEGIMKRAGIKHPFEGPRRTKTWKMPLLWNRKAEMDSVRRRVFTCSMSDFFHTEADPWRPDIWQLVRQCEALDWLILTKQSERITECLPGDWGETGYPNVWLGVTCGHSRSYHRVADLLQIPATIKFISAEPLLGRLDFRHYLPGIDWVITGCEQAAKGTRRPMELEWVRDIYQQCLETGTAHYFKQYYAKERGIPRTDGVLDDKVCQRFPRQLVQEV